jgi:hypothetical protein
MKTVYLRNSISLGRIGMQIVKLLIAAVVPFALLGCPDKAADTKPDPAASAAKPATPLGATPPPATAAVPAKSGGW